MSKKAKEPDEPKAPIPEQPEVDFNAEEIAFYKRTKLNPASLKKLFTGDIKPGTPLKKLTELLASRVHEGRRQSLADYRIYAAIDEAYNAALNQITPTLIGKILNPAKRMTAKEVEEQMASWGLSEDLLFTEVTETVDNKKVEKKILNRETFWKVLVPIVKSYVTIRQAKLFNDRNNSPFFSYQPVKLTEEDDLLGEIVTQIVEKVVNDYGYRAVFRQALLQALKYAVALVFPSEAWHSNTQADDAGNEYSEREGLRYNIPHPTRMAWDRNYRASTFNTDTGCEWALYWRLVRYGEVKDNSSYYNQEKIVYGTNWFHPEYSKNYFTEIYPCVLKPPLDMSTWGSNNREKMATVYNSNSDHDKALFLTDLFCKLKPKQWGLGDYKFDVWFRFVMASDDTVVWVEPLPYCPVTFLGYDSDESAAISPSMALECIPWQDVVGNILSQHLLTIRQNLMKIMPYDSDQVTPATIKEIEAHGKETMSITWFPFSSRKSRASQQDTGNLFKPVSFGMQNTTELITTLNTVLNIMERLLVMSASETGSAGPHVQTAEEMRVLSTNTSTRVEYTDSFVDDFFQAWKKQLFDAAKAFMDDEFTVQLSNLSEDGVKAVQSLGFKVSEGDSKKKVKTITGSKEKLSLYSFISSREGKNRLQNPQIATILLQTVQTVAANQMLSEKIGAEQLLAIINRAAHLAGAPPDFKLRVDPNASQQIQMQQLAEEVKKMSAQLQQGAAQAATQEVSQQLAPVMQQTGQKLQQDEAAIQQLGQGMQQLNDAAKQQQAQIQQIAQLVSRLNQIIEGAMQGPPAPPAGQPMTEEQMYAGSPA